MMACCRHQRPHQDLMKLHSTAMVQSHPEWHQWCHKHLDMTERGWYFHIYSCWHPTNQENSQYWVLTSLHV